MTLPIPDVFDVPLFPLPGVVLFPGTVLPLRVFEPRYLKLLEDVLGGESLIGMAQLKPASFAESSAAPAVFDVLGVGRVVAKQPLKDGTFHIALLGQGRCRINCEIPNQPYRIARVSALADALPDDAAEKSELRELRGQLVALASKLAERNFEKDAAEQFHLALKERRDVGAMTDLLASIYIHETALRQTLLENHDVLARARIMLAILETLSGRNELRPPQVQYTHDDICLN